MGLKARLYCIAAVLVLSCLLTGCSSPGAKEPEIPAVPRNTLTTFLEPQAPGEVVHSNQFVTVDASCTQDGYMQICYSGTAAKAKVQLTNPDGTVYLYTLRPGSNETLPLTGGSGTYGVAVLENAYDNLYAMVFSEELTAENVAEFSPYLYPNQHAWFADGSTVCELGMELSRISGDDLQYVNRVYSYVVDNIDYDHDLAADPPVDYIPDIENTLATGKGICFDYASLMTALLRSQGIPTKLVVGYSGVEYHAWISVYLEQTGWVDGVIYFDGQAWSRMDPTLAAGNRGTSVKDYVNNNSNYRERFFY